jgi:hypothetical protein
MAFTQRSIVPITPRQYFELWKSAPPLHLETMGLTIARPTGGKLKTNVARSVGCPWGVGYLLDSEGKKQEVTSDERGLIRAELGRVINGLQRQYERPILSRCDSDELAPLVNQDIKRLQWLTLSEIPTLFDKLPPGIVEGTSPFCGFEAALDMLSSFINGRIMATNRIREEICDDVISRFLRAALQSSHESLYTCPQRDFNIEIQDFDAEIVRGALLI